MSDGLEINFEEQDAIYLDYWSEALKRRGNCSHCNKRMQRGEIGHYVSGDRLKLNLPPADKKWRGLWRCNECKDIDRKQPILICEVCGRKSANIFDKQNAKMCMKCLHDYKRECENE